jgi:hypothetical protein
VRSFTGQSLGVPDGAVALMTLGPGAHEAPTPADLDAANAAVRKGASAGDDALRRHAAPADGRAQGLAMEVGDGRLVMLAEAAMLSAQIIRFADGERTREIQVGMNVPGNDNRQFALIAAVLAVLRIWLPHEWWRALAAAGAVLSIVLMALFLGLTKLLPIATALAILGAALDYWSPLAGALSSPGSGRIGALCGQEHVQLRFVPPAYRMLKRWRNSFDSLGTRRPPRTSKGGCPGSSGVPTTAS